MARLDDLIGQIKDVELQQKFVAALADLRRRQRFGLVFEEHIPESTCLLSFPILPGATVLKRSDPEGKKLFRVKTVNGRSRATIEPVEGGEAESLPAKELMTVKRFGEPIYPALTSLGYILNGPADKPYHAVINGENFHALQLFVYLYEGQADCIYLDPPYNTGARDWKYNNRYVDLKDGWRHSKWLSFMEKRLVLARRLLKPDGVLIVTIDEHEVHHLGMLLEKLFPDYLRHMVSIVINPKGTGKLNFARVDEYAIFCVPNLGKSVITGAPSPAAQAKAVAAVVPDLFAWEDTEEEDDEEEEGDSDIEPAEVSVYPFPDEELPDWELRHARRRGGESSYREQRKNQFYPIYVDTKKGVVVRAGAMLPLGEQPNMAKVDGLKPIWPIDKEGHHRCWRYIPSAMQERIDKGLVILGRYNKPQDTYTINYWVRRTASKKLKTVWWEKPHDAGTHGTTLLHKMLGYRNAFPFPKSVYAVKDALAAVVRHRPEALIIDFFAGSGTTFHATCMLNADDGGRRRSILVTNNEVAEKTAWKLHRTGVYRGDDEFEKHGIFEHATRPRCEAAVTGKRPDGAKIPGNYADGRPMSQGYPENVEFFRIDYLDPDDIDLGTQFEAILPSLWLAAGGVGPREHGGKGFSLPDGSRYAVLFDESAFRKLRKALDTRPDVTHVWIVTDSEDAYAEMRWALPTRLSTSMLYRDYLANFRINTRQTI